MGMRFGRRSLRRDGRSIRRCSIGIVCAGEWRRMRLFMLMPPRASWERRSAAAKCCKKGPLQPYERVFNPEGAHFEAVPAGAFDRLLEGQTCISPARCPHCSLAPRGISGAGGWRAARVPRTVTPLLATRGGGSCLGGDQPVYLLRVSDLRASPPGSRNGRPRTLRHHAGGYLASVLGALPRGEQSWMKKLEEIVFETALRAATKWKSFDLAREQRGAV